MHWKIWHRFHEMKKKIHGSEAEKMDAYPAGLGQAGQGSEPKLPELKSR
ncbi:hypothetical protein AB434_0784 [Heyndrickxia coagulans]|uniref:Uncharacterized protein n=1 Tax=Heyndrickxia coagulans TaxID=1398 RepID=A0AAN0T356_HEYCO|nr:hypothetical protein SB48_HM08orf00579 [Heyndrickxia coagulans]AKN53189.1 hypothetical protein AB434_0784 [Heyndrickxia coagulans]